MLAASIEREASCSEAQKFSTVSACLAHALGDLAPHLSGKTQAATLAQALEAARAIEDSFHRAYTLYALASHLPEELLPQALKAARALEDTRPRPRPPRLTSVRGR